MIIVACKNEIAALTAANPSAYVISVVDRAEDAPALEGVDPTRRLVIALEDACLAANGGACRNAATRLVEFVQNWKPSEAPLLMHCERGVSRSTACAYIAMCAKAPEAKECDLAARLRAAAPHADPNILLIDCADAVLGREGRMTDAVLSLPDDPPPPCGEPARIEFGETL